MNRTEITRDAIMDLPRVTGFVLESERRGLFDILTCDENERGMRVGYAVSAHTGLIVRFEQTGTKRYRSGGWALRARYQVAEDSGDLAGTLVFDGPGLPGRIPAGLQPGATGLYGLGIER